MTVFLRTVAGNALWLGLAFVLLALYFARQATHYAREARLSIFGLEREQARRRVSRARMRALLAILLAVGSYCARVYALPLLPLPPGEQEHHPAAQAPSPTPTRTPFIVPSLVVEETLPATTAQPATPTPVPATPTPAASPSPTPAPAPPANCPNPGVQITSPGMGAVVSGTVAISGTANIESFQFYKVEIAAGDPPTAWSVITDIHRKPVQAGVLEMWNTAPYPAGTYWIRLVVVDVTGNYPDPCAIAITLQK